MAVGASWLQGAGRLPWRAALMRCHRALGWAVLPAAVANVALGIANISSFGAVSSVSAAPWIAAAGFSVVGVWGAAGAARAGALPRRPGDTAAALSLLAALSAAAVVAAGVASASLDTTTFATTGGGMPGGMMPSSTFYSGQGVALWFDVWRTQTPGQCF